MSSLLPVGDKKNPFPELEPVLRLHRGEDGYLAVVKNADFQHPEFLQAKALEQWFPQFKAELLQDSYFTPNGFWKPRRREKDLRYLNACWVDLDSYNVGVSPLLALHEILQKGEKGELPPASMLVYSGRGCWAFWMLHEEQDPGQPARAWPRQVKDWKAVQVALANRCRDLGADAGASDGARFTRWPHSINSKSNERVRWLVHGEGLAFSYALSDLQHFLGLQAAPLPLKLVPPKPPLKLVEESWPTRTQDGGKDPVKVAAGKIGYRMAMERRWSDWMTVYNLRDGFTESRPSRNQAMLVGSAILLRRHNSRDETLKELTLLNRKNKPPLSDQELWSIMNGTDLKRRPLSYRRMGEMLGVTRGEAEHLHGVYFEIPSTPKPIGFKERRRIIREEIDRRGARPSIRKMIVILKDRNVVCSVATIQRDYRILPPIVTRKLWPSVSEAR